MSLHESSVRIWARSAKDRGGILLSPVGLARRCTSAIAVRATSVLSPFISTRPPGWRARQNAAYLGRLGDLEVRLAVSASEIRRAQALRYRVFYEEMSAVADFRTRQTRRDADRFDSVCDHLLVVDHRRRARAFGQPPEIVGTYRLLRQDVAHESGGFYSEAEFNLAPLLHRRADLRFLELGRSCVLAGYRNRRTLELLWHGIWAYVLRHGIDVMIGCASLEGTDPQKLALPLSFLHHHCRAPDEWTIAARADRRVDMDRLSVDAVTPKAALRTLPPLLRGYLRLGGYVGDGAVIDRQFNTTDVAIVLPVARIAGRYVDHFGADASRYAVSRALPENEPLVAA